MSIIQRLNDAVAAVAPIAGVAIGDPGDKSTWRVSFLDSATDLQKAAADNVIAGFDPVAIQNAEDARKAALLSDATRLDMLSRLASATPAQIDAYVDAQVTDLASARTMFKRIIRVLSNL